MMSAVLTVVMRPLTLKVIIMECEKCKSKVFFVDGELVKELGCGDLHNRNCVRCTYSKQYNEYKHFDEKLFSYLKEENSGIPVNDTD